MVCLDDADEGFCQVTAKDGKLKAEKVEGSMYSLPVMQATESIATLKELKESVDGLKQKP